MIRVSRASGRHKGSLPPGRAPERAPVPLRIKYSTPGGDIVYRRTIWPLGSGMSHFRNKKVPLMGAMEENFSKRTADGATGHRRKFAINTVAHLHFFNEAT